MSDPLAGMFLSGPPGSRVPQYAPDGWDPSKVDGGPDCEFCGEEMHSPECDNEDCPGELVQCEVIVFHGSPNPDSAAFGPDEACENYAVPGSTVCEAHAYEVDEPVFTPPAPRPERLAWPVRMRSDGRLEVAEDEVAHDRHVCLAGDVECVLINGHDGPCTPVRQDWSGPSSTYEHPHRFA